jgi:hypothetical protein
LSKEHSRICRTDLSLLCKPSLLHSDGEHTRSGHTDLSDWTTALPTIDDSTVITESLSEIENEGPTQMNNMFRLKIVSNIQNWSYGSPYGPLQQLSPRSQQLTLSQPPSDSLQHPEPYFSFVCVGESTLQTCRVTPVSRVAAAGARAKQAASTAGCSAAVEDCPCPSEV